MRVAIIGLDGVPFDLVASLAQEGHLPNLRRVLEEGVSGVLWSTVPSISPVAWTSMATGLNPGKHGVFGFVDRRFRPHSSRDLRGKAIWDLASSAGKTVICLNVPFTYPPYPLRGLMVSGPPSPRGQVNAYPGELVRRLEDIGYRPDVELPGEEYEGLREDDFVRQAEEITRARGEALLMLMEDVDWDLLYAVFTTPDRVQHVFFGRATRGSPFYDPRGRRTLIRYYGLLDEVVGKVVAALPSDAVVMLVSDHGFEPLYKYVGLHNLLSDFLAARNPLRKLYEVPVKLVGRAGLMSLAKRALRKLGIAGEARRKLSGGFECGMGYIYLTGERPEGELEELVRFLCSVVDEERGLRVFEHVYRREELYHGPFLKEAPDLILVPETGYEPKAILPEKFVEVRPVEGMTCKTGTHMGPGARRGFFAMAGDGVAEGLRLDASVYDVAPTALHILGLPVPEEVDGDVLSRAFEEGSELARRPVRWLKRGLRGELALRARRARELLRRKRALGRAGTHG